MMQICLITGAAGLVGSEVARVFAPHFDRMIGIDNDMRAQFFGSEASTAWNARRLTKELAGRYEHLAADIRDRQSIEQIFSQYNADLAAIVHCAAQPSHDWAARDPLTDFEVNAGGTLNLLEATRSHCPGAVFIHMSTNKVYGDRPNQLPLIETETRWEVDPAHPFSAHGIDESMNIDQTMHSLFGVSKTAGDLLAQEYARYFGLKTGIFRGGCLSGPAHAGAELHGFLAWLMRCTISGRPYRVNGYKGKQVRDNIHSRDLAEGLLAFYHAPRPGEVYNIGGSRHSNCSMREAIALCEEISGKKLNWNYSDEHRAGDHIWYISDVRKFQRHYPEWRYQYTLPQILSEICQALSQRADRI
jgi:CDP-paratose 2-epimerase